MASSRGTGQSSKWILRRSGANGRDGHASEGADHGTGLPVSAGPKSGQRSVLAQSARRGEAIFGKVPAKYKKSGTISALVGRSEMSVGPSLGRDRQPGGA